jgi:hypothetical protein
MADDGTEHRRKIAGWLTIENVIQTALILLTMGAMWGSLQGTLTRNAQDILFERNERQASVALERSERSQADSESKSERVQIEKSILELAANVASLQAKTTQQTGEIIALQNGRSEDRRILTDIAANVAVLLDRTNPDKGNKTHP